jgi:hypothetical protein
MSNPIDIPFAGGIDTLSDPRAVDAPRLLEADNVVYTANGLLQKCRGLDRLDELTSSTTFAAGLAVRDNQELLAFDDDNLYSYDPATNTWLDRDDCVVVNSSEAGVTVRSANQTIPDLCTHRGITVAAWYDSDGGSDNLVYSVKSNETGAYYTADTTISGGQNARIVPAGNAILLFTYHASGTAIRVRPIFPGAPSATPTASDIVTDVHTDAVYDACPAHDGQAAALVYKRNNGGTQEIRVLHVLPNGQVCPTTENTNYANATVLDTNATYAPVSAVAIGCNSQYLFVAWLKTSATAYLSYTVCNARVTGTTLTMATTGAAPLRLSAATTDKRITIVPYDNGSTTCVLAKDNENASNTYDDRVTAYVPSLSSISADGAELISCTLAAHGFYRKRPYLVVANDTPLQSSVWLVSPQVSASPAPEPVNALWVSRNLYGVGHGRASGVHMPRTNRVDGDDGTFRTVAIWRRRLVTAEDASDDTRSEFFERKALRELTYSFPSSGRYQHVTAGRSLYMAGGVGWQYDGKTCCEQGPLVFPEQWTLASSNSTGTLTSSAQYTYRIYYEYTNVHGERVRSAAITKEITLGASDDTVTITIPPLGFTNTGYVDASGDGVSAVTPVVYRSTANADLTQGAFLYRVSSPDPTSSGNNRWLRDEYATLTFIDAHPDTSIVEFEIDYLSVGELNNDAMPACSIISEGNGRVWCAGLAENPQALVVSKQRAYGMGTEISLETYVEVPDDGGPITALAPMGNAVAVFKRDRIYLIGGDGPTNTGQGGFSSAHLVTFDVGCVNPRSVAPFPGGVLFQSAKGIRALDSSFQVQPLGAPVDGYVLGRNGYVAIDIAGAVTLPDRSEVRFISADGRSLVYNYLVGAWTTLSVMQGIATVSWNNRCTFITASGRIYSESDTGYTLDGGHYAMRIKLPWIRTGGIAGRQRFRRLHLLGTYYSAHALVAKFRYDYTKAADTASFATTSVIDLDTYGAGNYGDDYYGGSSGSDSVYRVSACPARQRCTALSIEIYDTPASGGAHGRALEIANISVDIQNESGHTRLASNRNFTASSGPNVS